MRSFRYEEKGIGETIFMFAPLQHWLNTGIMKNWAASPVEPKQPEIVWMVWYIIDVSIQTFTVDSDHY